jgi:hypothetical protein
MHLYRIKEDMTKTFLSTYQHYALISLAMQLQNLRLSSRITINAASKVSSSQGIPLRGGLTNDNLPAFVLYFLIR